MNKRMPLTKNDPPGTQSLQRTFAVLRALSSRHGGWKLGELAAYCQLHHSTLHRILAALSKEEMVARDPRTQLYVLGRLAFELGVAAQPRHDWRALSAQTLDELAIQTGDTAFLNIRSGPDSVCIDRREGSYPVKALTVEIGARRPLCVSAGGAAILTRLPDAEIQAILAASQTYMKRFPADRLAAVMRVLETSRQLGYGYNSNLIVNGVSAIGVAITDSLNRPIAALSIAAISSRITGSRLQKIVALLQDQAHSLSRKLQQHQLK